MKKFIIGIFAVIGLVATMSVAGVNAAPEAVVSGAGPYEGVFHGTVYAPDGSTANMSLDLTHRGSVVEGTVYLGDGLNIDAGVCGAGTIPASAIQATGKTSAVNPNKLSTTSTFDVSGISVKVTLNGEISGDSLDAAAKIDLPWLCGSDPVITGKLQRA